MQHVVRPARRRSRLLVTFAALVVVALAVTACGSSSDNASGGSSTNGSNSGRKVRAALILKVFSNPYFVSMRNSAEQTAKQLGVDLAVSAGSSDADTGAQIKAINNAIAAGDKGIIITSNGDAVNAALQRARTAGLYTIALDTLPEPPSTVNLTYATDNAKAGELIGKWTAAKLAGRPADIAMLDAVNTAVISVDVQRDHGFLDGMGIPVGNEHINGKEPKSGNYTGGKGGTYKIACQLPTNGTIPQGKSAMQTCLQKDPGINVVYAVNEQAAQGAAQALATSHNDALVVAIDGGCANLPFVQKGQIDATAGQFPGKMASMGVRAIQELASGQGRPQTSPGEDFFDTGVKLYTNDAQPGIPSTDVAAAKSQCWG